MKQGTLMKKLISATLAIAATAASAQAGTYESLYACYRVAAINYVHSENRSVSLATIEEMFDANWNDIADDFRFMAVTTIEAINEGNSRSAITEILRESLPSPGPFIDCMMGYYEADK